jgi:hypothetical protein
MLKIDHRGLGAGLPHLISVVGIADQGDGLVSAL